MNEFNDKGEPHGYWKSTVSETHYNNGVKQGKYKNYWDMNFKRIFCRGNYHMNERTNTWEWYDTDGKTLYRKEFYL